MSDSINLQDIKKNLTSLSMDILEMLKKSESLSYKQIKEQLNVGQNKASKEIARLEGALLIETKKSDIDGRENKLSLTEYGYKILKI